MESLLRVLVRDWDFTDSEKNKSEVIKILKEKKKMKKLEEAKKILNLNGQNARFF